MSTTFVIGAGASASYGLPTAPELKRQICDRPPAITGFPAQLHWNETLAKEEEKRSARIAARLRDSGQQSIDAWLPENKSYEAWGKYAIAEKLVLKEKQALPHIAGDWLAWFFQRFHTKRSLRKDDFNIITFNYDRLFELAMVKMLRNSFDMPVNDAVAMVESVNLVHVYGQLELPTLSDLINGHAELDHNTYLRASQGIRLIGSERGSSDPNLKNARQWIFGADRIVFLGFSFDETNLRTIGAHRDERDWARRQRPCIASAYQMEQGEREIATSHLGYEPRYGRFDDKCWTFLRHAVNWA